MLSFSPVGIIVELPRLFVNINIKTRSRERVSILQRSNAPKTSPTFLRPPQIVLTVTTNYN